MWGSQLVRKVPPLIERICILAFDNNGSACRAERDICLHLWKKVSIRIAKGNPFPLHAVLLHFEERLTPGIEVAYKLLEDPAHSFLVSIHIAKAIPSRKFLGLKGLIEKPADVD